MIHQNKYSTIILPSDKVINEVKSMKDLLATKIGWYPSKNAQAHITINEFDAPESELFTIKQHLYKITKYLKTRDVFFDKLDSFPNGAFFLAPDDNSKIYLKTIMQEINKSFQYKTSIKSTKPHISIGRKLSADNITLGYNLFTTPKTSFLCDRLALRVLNTNRKQFDIIEEFVFKGETRTGEQGKLLL